VTTELPDGDLIAQIIWRTKHLQHLQQQMLDIGTTMKAEAEWLRDALRDLPEAQTEEGRANIAKLERSIAQLGQWLAAPSDQPATVADYRPSDHVRPDAPTDSEGAAQ
jgi:hypothetical protein